MFVTVIRTFLLYLLIVVALRVMGKRQIAEMQPTELVCTILISNLATLPIEDANIPFLSGVVPILTIICLEVFVSVLSAHNRDIKSLVSGNACIVISHGKIQQQVLSDLRITAEDLLNTLHANQIFDPREVVFAAFETSGKLALFQKESPQGQDNQQSENPPMPIVVNGKIIKNNMHYCRTDKSSIQKIFETEKVTMEEVFLMILDPQKNYYIIKKEDKN